MTPKSQRFVDNEVLIKTTAEGRDLVRGIAKGYEPYLLNRSVIQEGFIHSPVPGLDGLFWWVIDGEKNFAPFHWKELNLRVVRSQKGRKAVNSA